MSSSSSQYNRRRLLAIAGVTSAAAATGLLRFGVARATSGPSSYTAAWSSVDQHPPAPEWFQDAKFGIYYHWGVFSVPAFASEWYPRNLYNAGSYENQHHIATYGDPSVWPYHNFINGANDKSGKFVQFAPKLVSAGGNWDPTAWAQLFFDAGAKFAGPVAEHHDGLSMWNSTVNEWNSVAKGPKLDLLRLHADAIRAKGLKLFVSLHHAYNFTGYYQYAPAQSTTTLKKLYGQLDTATENQLWYDKLKEVIDGYQPDVIWQDFNLTKVDEARRLQFLSYYYNQAVAWNTDVVATCSTSPRWPTAPSPPASRPSCWASATTSSGPASPSTPPAPGPPTARARPSWAAARSPPPARAPPRTSGSPAARTTRSSTQRCWAGQGAP